MGLGEYRGSHWSGFVMTLLNVAQSLYQIKSYVRHHNNEDIARPLGC